MLCRKCGSTFLRRAARKTFLQLRLFPLFNLYPWECCSCRKVLLYPRRLPEED